MTPAKFMFERQGLATVALDKSFDRGFDKLFDIAIENGAEEVNEQPDLETKEHIIYEVLVFLPWLKTIARLIDFRIDFLRTHTTCLATVLISELAYVPSDLSLCEKKSNKAWMN
ncbi:hypothetical protein NLJ89_g2295 [Agrocybe chaxingu]|uniref:TACO1/YebC-like second and third domain-containing protein n=1 Tax=Agrocybe chaxingu TaxID=84603 RepID=A0A9W8MY68_9AGAR|nr:hypothetical protein NLJ89_g2295 [Agrocybe chaxingu]